MNLYLFDVDNTMLDVDHLHKQAYEEMYEKVYNTKHSLSLPKGEERTTHNIIKCALTNKVPGKKIEEQMEEAVASMAKLYMSSVNPLFVHTNVPQILGKLNQKGMVGVFTGGARHITNTILKKAKLHDKFHHISTCDDAPTRKEIVKHAIENASLGRKFDKIFVIGDSPEDIEAAKSNNAIAVGVAMGYHNEEELKKSGADIVINNWEDTEGILGQLE